MHATTVESLGIIFREYGSSESSQPATAQVDFDQDSAHTEARLWKPRVNSELNAKIEMILLLVLSALGLGALIPQVLEEAMEKYNAQVGKDRVLTPPTISRRNLLKWADEGTRRS